MAESTPYNYQNNNRMKFRTLLLSLLAMAIALPSMAQLSSNNAATNYAKFKKFFNDDICTELALPYSAMTDDQLREQMSDIAKELVDVAIKIKNNAWEKNEKEFRIAKFKPQTDPTVWDNYLNVYTYSLMPCPAGIIGNDENIMIFVGGEVPSGVSLGVYKVAGNDGHGFLYNSLRAGLNVISMPEDTEAKMLFIEYYAYTDTTETSKKLADFPEIPMHFEGGHANGYFDVAKHDDAYWRELLAAHKADSVASSYPAIQVLGDKVMFHMTRKELAAVCPNTITDAINWWDALVKFEHKLMGVDKYYDRWNDRIMARNGTGSYMFATQGYTYYETYTLGEILPWKEVYSSPGRIWGPAHEIGHVNQGAINIVSCTEASNNLFSNAAIHSLGKTTTRGSGVAFCIDEFLKKTPFPLRGGHDIIGVSRMFFQLYLYFHATGKDTTFYPRLFEALRQEPLIHPKGAHTYAEEDQLRFAEKCCEIAQMDLSEFFEVWGFFEPMNQTHIGDYSDYYVTLTENVANKSRARMQQYQKKGGHLMFIEDRIKPSKREDGVEGYRIDFNEEYAIGKMGETGQWGDYIDESVKAEGYTYTIDGDYVIIDSKNGKGALGFKVYNAERNELISFSNTHLVKIPTYEKSNKLRVVAAQADGTDYEIPSLASTDDRVALQEKISLINSDIINKAYNGGTTTCCVGRFYDSALKQLKEICKKAEDVINGASSAHSYKEWGDMLDNYIERLKNTPGTRVSIDIADEYSINHIMNDGYYMADMDYGVELVTGLSLGKQKLRTWFLIPAEEEGYYYFKCKNEEYINEIVSIGTNCSGSSIENAVAIKVNYLDNGYVYLTLENGEYIGINSDYKIVSTEKMSAETQWNIHISKKNSANPDIDINFDIDFDFDTAIENIESERGEDEIYDLHGRKVTNPQKGIYIMNGKKIIIR